MIRISTLNYDVTTVSDALYDVSTTQWTRLSLLSDVMYTSLSTMNISVLSNVYAGGLMSISRSMYVGGTTTLNSTVTVNGVLTVNGPNQGLVLTNGATLGNGNDVTRIQNNLNVDNVVRIGYGDLLNVSGNKSNNANVDISGNLYTTGSIVAVGVMSASNFFTGTSNLNDLFVSFLSLSAYTSTTNASLMSLSNYVSNTVVSFLSLSNYTSTVNASLMSLSNYVSNTVVSFLSLSAYTSTANASLLSLSNYLSNTVVSFLSLSGYVSSVNASLMSLSNIVSARNVSFLSLSAYTSTVNASLMSLSNFVSTVDFDVMSLSNIVSVRNVSFLSLSGYVSSVNASLMSLSNIVSARNVSFLSLSGYVSSVNASLMSLSNFVSTVDFDVVSLTSFVSSFTTGLNVGAFVGINTNTKYEITTPFPVYHNIWVGNRSSGENFRVFASSLSFTVGVSTGLETLDYFETGTLSTTYFVHMNFVVPPNWHFVVSSSNNVAFVVRRMI